jgi:hypothetical protein
LAWLDGRLYGVLGLFEKVRGAAAKKIPHFLVPSGNVRGKTLVEWDLVDDGRQYGERVVEVDLVTRERTTVYEARTMQDVLELCLAKPSAPPGSSALEPCLAKPGAL